MQTAGPYRKQLSARELIRSSIKFGCWAASFNRTFTRINSRADSFFFPIIRETLINMTIDVKSSSGRLLVQSWKLAECRNLFQSVHLRCTGGGSTGAVIDRLWGLISRLDARWSGAFYRVTHFLLNYLFWISHLAAGRGFSRTPWTYKFRGPYFDDLTF